MTAPTPETGFRIATGFLKVVADDREARKDTDRFLRDTDRKMATGGRRSGGIFGRNFGLGMFAPLLAGVRAVIAPITDLFRKALAAALKLTAFAAIAGVVTTVIGGLGAAIYKLIPALAELGQVAIAASGSLLLIPGAIATGIAALAAFKLGLNGIKDALKAGFSGDVDKLNEALKKLAPNAAAFVREMIKLKPAFDRLRLNIQNALFANMAKTVKDLGKTLLPALMIPLVDMARVLNATLRDGLLFLNEQATRLTLARTLAAAADAAGNLGAAFRPLLRIVTDVTLVSARMFAQFTGGAAAAMNRWADSISAMAQSGALAELITNGLDALKQFGSLALDIVGIFKGIFAASGSGGFFAFFDRLNKLINSAAGQANLKAIFGDLERIGTALAPVMVTLLAALVPVADAIARISVSFAPGLQALVAGLAAGITALVPGIQAVEPILRAVGAYLPAIGTGISLLLTAFSPGALALIEGLGQALTVLAMNAGPLGTALAVVASALGGVLVPVAQVVSDLIIGLGPGVKVFLDALAVGLGQLAAVAPLVGQGVGDLLSAIAPVLTAAGPALAVILAGIASGLTRIADVAGPTIELLSTGLADTIERLLPLLLEAAEQALPAFLNAGVAFAGAFGRAIQDHLPQIVTLFDRLGTVMGQLITDAGPAFAEALQNLIPLLPGLISGGLALTAAFVQLLEAIRPLLPVITAIVTNPAGLMALTGSLYLLAFSLQITTGWIKAIGLVVEWLSGLVGDAVDELKKFGRAVPEAIGTAVAWFRNLGSTVLNAIGDFGGLLYNAGRNLIQGLINGIRSMIPGLGGVLGWITDHLPSWKGPEDVDRRILEPSGRAVMAGFRRGIESGVAGLRAQLGGLTMAMPAMAGAAGAGSVSVAPPTVYVTVRLADREMESLVEDVLVTRPEMVASAADAGHQERGFAGTRNRLERRR